MKNLVIPIALAAALSAGAVPFASAAPARYAVSHGRLGTGTVTLWQQGGNIGITVDRAAMASLPSKDTRIDLVPKSGPYRLVELDWNAHGHPPAGVYTVPHFDAHFYVIPKSERDAIAFAAPGRARKAPDAIVPAGYITDGTVQPQMGMHYVSLAQPEFHGKPFTVSQIWGYNRGHLAFVEAMFTKRFIDAHHSWTQPLAKPKKAAVASNLGSTLSVSPNAGGFDVIVSK